MSSKSVDEVAGFTAPEERIFASRDSLMKIWSKGNRLKNGFEVIVAEKGGRVIGFIVFNREEGSVDIDNLDIRKDEQGKGVGRTLVAYVENIAVAGGYSLMKTDTTESAQGVPWKSYGFWTRMGYKDTGERLPTKWSFKTIPFIKRLR